MFENVTRDGNDEDSMQSVGRQGEDPLEQFARGTVPDVNEDSRQAESLVRKVCDYDSAFCKNDTIISQYAQTKSSVIW